MWQLTPGTLGSRNTSILISFVVNIPKETSPTSLSEQAVTLTIIALLSACTDPVSKSGTPSQVAVDESPQTSLGQTNSNTTDDTTNEMDFSRDYHSYSNPDDIIVTHISLDIEADFEEKTLYGIVSLDLERVNESANTLILDTRDLDIINVIAPELGADSKLEFELSPADPNLGAALNIVLPNDVNRVVIEYLTSPDASGSAPVFMQSLN